MTELETQSKNSGTTRHRLPPTPQGSVRELVRDPLNYFLSITREHGDIVCYRPAPDTAYLINHPDYVHHVLVDNRANYSKDTSSNQAFKTAIGPGLINYEGDEWRERRRLMQPNFHIDRLEPLDGMIVQAASDMLDRWQERFDAARPIDIPREMAALTMRITCQALFGVDLHEEVYAIGELINGVATLLEKPNHPRLQSAIHEYAGVADRIIEAHRRDAANHDDLLSTMMTAGAEHGGRGLTDEQLRNEVMGLLLAGHETTANALTWAYYLLAKHPWASDRLRDEVRRNPRRAPALRSRCGQPGLSATRSGREPAALSPGVDHGPTRHRG